MTELKPCPFCGGEVEIDMLDSEQNRNVKIYNAVHCTECHQWFFKGLSREKTIAAWNRRPNQWIPVSERLPDDAYGCLLIVEEDDYNGTTHEVLLPYFAGYDGEQWNDGDGQRIPFEVTHWMPLPQPLEGDTE